MILRRLIITKRGTTRRPGRFHAEPTKKSTRSGPESRRLVGENGGFVDGIRAGMHLTALGR